MDHIAEIRRRHLISAETISEIAKRLNLSCPSVHKALKAETEPVYKRQVKPTPKLGDFFKGQMTDWLELTVNSLNAGVGKHNIFFSVCKWKVIEALTGLCTNSRCFRRRFVLDWKRETGKQTVAKKAFISLVFPAGETCQVD